MDHNFEFNSSTNENIERNKQTGKNIFRPNPIRKWSESSDLSSNTDNTDESHAQLIPDEEHAPLTKKLLDGIRKCFGRRKEIKSGAEEKIQTDGLPNIPEENDVPENSEKSQAAIQKNQELRDTINNIFAIGTKYGGGARFALAETTPRADSPTLGGPECSPQSEPCQGEKLSDDEHLQIIFHKASHSIFFAKKDNIDKVKARAKKDLMKIKEDSDMVQKAIILIDRVFSQSHGSGEGEKCQADLNLAYEKKVKDFIDLWHRIGNRREGAVRDIELAKQKGRWKPENDIYEPTQDEISKNRQDMHKLQQWELAIAIGKKEKEFTAVRRSLDSANSGDSLAGSGVNLSDPRCKDIADKILNDLIEDVLAPVRKLANKTAKYVYKEKNVELSKLTEYYKKRIILFQDDNELREITEKEFANDCKKYNKDACISEAAKLFNKCIDYDKAKNNIGCKLYSLCDKFMSQIDAFNDGAVGLLDDDNLLQGRSHKGEKSKYQAPLSETQKKMQKIWESVQAAKSYDEDISPSPS